MTDGTFSDEALAHLLAEPLREDLLAEEVKHLKHRVAYLQDQVTSWERMYRREYQAHMALLHGNEDEDEDEDDE